MRQVENSEVVLLGRNSGPSCFGDYYITSFSRKENELIGYYSYDPFSPVSAIVLWAIAGAIYWFGRRKEKKP